MLNPKIAQLNPTLVHFEFSYLEKLLAYKRSNTDF